MIEVVLQDVGKKFHDKWVFRKLSHRLQASGRYAIVGPNGSGKSTLLQIMAGFISPSKGEITWKKQDKEIAAEKLYPEIAMAAPYMEVIEEYSLDELLRFHARFKNFPSMLNSNELVHVSGLESSRSRAVKYYSSGMKQRVRLSLAILTDSPLLLLDEPCTNLDQAGRRWYRRLLDEYCSNKTIVVASNHQSEEYGSDFELIETR